MPYNLKHEKMLNIEMAITNGKSNITVEVMKEEKGIFVITYPIIIYTYENNRNHYQRLES